MTGREDSSGRGGQDYPEDTSLQEAADRLRQVMRSPVMRPAFRERLRSQVVAARAEVIAERAGQPGQATSADHPAPPRRRALRRPAVLGWAAATAVAVAAGVIVIVNGPPGGGGPVSVAARSDVSGAVSADPGRPVRMRFTRPLDHAATLAALHLTPAAAVRSSWQGNTLTISPVHGFAPDTGYVLTIDRSVARTAAGAPLAADIHLAFGTAPVVTAGRGPAAPAALARKFVAAAADGSEAVVARNGALLVTAAQPGPTTGYSAGLVRIGSQRAARLSAATDAICVSRSGNSIAYLRRSGSGSEVVFANSQGTAVQQIPVAVDQGSPLGWIGDAQVSYVGGGRLRAVDRAGHIRILSDTPIDMAHDGLTISPGGRYAYLQPAAGAGQLIDLATGASRTLPGITGQPAFSSDGATVIWIRKSRRAPRLAVAASGGGPVLTAPLPVRPGAQLSDLSVAPDGSRFAYSVTRPGHRAELRLAALPGGQTLAVSTAGAGHSPDWSPSGHMFTVRSDGPAGPHIDAISVGGPLDDFQASLRAAVTRFANAQISADAGAQRALTAAGVALPALPHLTRFAVLWVLPAAGQTATARVRFTIDPRPGHPVAMQAEESLTLGPQPAAGLPQVRAVTAGPLRAAPAGPQLVHLDTSAAPGAVLLTFNSDLDPASVAAAFRLATPGGADIGSTVSYDAATRTVTVRPTSPAAAARILVRIGAGLRDINGRTMRTGLKILVPQFAPAPHG